MPDPTAARAAVLDLLAGVRDRLDQAPVRRGKPATLQVWRDTLTDKSAAAVPRQLAHQLREAKERVVPVRDALRAARDGGLYPSESAPLQAATATEYVLAVAAEAVARLDDGLPRSPTRAWLAEDEVADLGRQLEPLLAALTKDLADQVVAEFVAAGASA